MFRRNKQATFDEIVSPEVTRKNVHERARSSYIARGLFSLAGLSIAAIAMLSLSDDVGNRETQSIGDLAPKKVLIAAGLAELGVAVGAVAEKRNAIRTIQITAGDHTEAVMLFGTNPETAEENFHEEIPFPVKKRPMIERVKDIGWQSSATAFEIATGVSATVVATHEGFVPQPEQGQALLFIAGYAIAAGVSAAASVGSVRNAELQARNAITSAWMAADMVFSD